MDENPYKQPDSSIDNKIQINLLRFLRQYKMCFTVPEKKLLNDKQILAEDKTIRQWHRGVVVITTAKLH